MKRLALTEIARADLASIRRYSLRTWGRDQTVKYMENLCDTMTGLVRGTVITRARDDLGPAIHMTVSGSHSICPRCRRSPHRYPSPMARRWLRDFELVADSGALND